MPAGRPRGGNGGFRGHPAPMSERQQLALLLQMTSQDKESGGISPSSVSVQSTSSEQHRASRSRCRNERGETPLHVAAIRGDETQVRRLLARGADPNAKDFAGWSPLHEACNHGWLGTARILIEAGASVNALGLDDDTPLHDAAVNGHQELVKLLVDSGADSTLKNKRGKTPVDVASGSLDRSSFVSDKSTEARSTVSQVTSPAAGGAVSSSSANPRADDIVARRLFDAGSAASLVGEQQQREQQRPTGSSANAPSVVEDSGAPCEMRRTPPQNKVDRSGTGQSGGSPRVTLRLNQVRTSRDDKKSGTAPRHGVTSQSQNMDGSKSSALSGGNPVATGSANNSSASGESGDVYEFKSSKEATPVRGASTSPNPGDKDKDVTKAAGGSGSNASGTVSALSAVAEISASNTDETSVSASPAAKRTLESDNPDEQDEENRRKKRKESESTKDNSKTVVTGRLAAGRNNPTNEKCTKLGKLGGNTAVGKNNQATSIANVDRKSPSSSAATGSSPKPASSMVGSTNTKAATPAPPESDGEDDRSKSSDSNSAPKVPPLKIVIPQSTVSEQEQGNRNGKNTSNRNHQLPYVVASSNSNDSTDKDQNQSASGTTSPTEGAPSKSEEKKDFTGALHGEERSTHHQRVLRSSHRSGNGANGSVISKETAGASSGNGSYSNSSPLPAAASSNDRSNNSSPQQRHNSPTPETTSQDPTKTTTTEQTSVPHSTSKTTTTSEKTEKNSDGSSKTQKDTESSDTASSTQSTSTPNTTTPPTTVELHPRKRKMKPNKEAQQAAATAAANEAAEAANTGPEVHPHDQPITNCYQLFLNIRKQIERRRKGLFPVQPKPPQGFKDYLMNRCTYVLAGNANKEPNVNPPVSLHCAMKDLYMEQEKERYRLRMQHVVEKEKLVLSVEQEILRVHGRAARALANQSLPFSVCTILKDEEVYNVITPEQEEKDRNARSRYNGRLFLSWLQDVDDKWEKIKEAMLLRHHNEAESLHAVQRMDWEWKMKEVGLCDFKARPQIEDLHVPMVHVSDDFDLLPA
ncbi:ankyrin repeat domain-containing protein 12 isoform X1 [Neodiprion pinetum]|uniref:ankyrin repeat domain-containing protein 12 isoform X1 n=1 Tax=Neodiprion pinetum TaxID=441929 RepID=UPI001EDD6802|nr:ankyrin repeat domain-containing protein 12-like isoform X1 [Neodiprion pinetum]